MAAARFPWLGYASLVCSIGSFHPNSIFFVAEKIETDDFFTVCFLCIDHALYEISDF
jgi:hypothetical protein